MTRKSRNIDSQDPRYEISKDRVVGVVIEKSVDGKVVPVEAELANISRRGAKLRTNERFSQTGALSLKITANDLEGAITVPAEVCWTQPAGDGQWWLDCRFSPEIPDTVLTKLAIDGHLDRRRHVREKTSVPATAIWELGTGETPLTLLDVSAGGFCLLSQQMGQPGERVLLRLATKEGKEILVTAKARWQMTTSEGHVVGCEFVNKFGYATLQQALGPPEPAAAEESVLGWLGSLLPWRSGAEVG